MLLRMGDFFSTILSLFLKNLVALQEMKPEMKNIDETSKQALVDGGMTLIEYDDSFYQEILALDTVQALYDKIDADVNGLGTTLQEELAAAQG